MCTSRAWFPELAGPAAVPYPTAAGPAHHLNRPIEQPPPMPGQPDCASGEHAMSADLVDEPERRTDDDVLGRLAAIDHQLSTQLAIIGTLPSQLDKILANRETLIRSAGRS